MEMVGEEKIILKFFFNLVKIFNYFECILVILLDGILLVISVLFWIVYFLYYYSWWNICILNLFVIVGYVEWKEYYKYFLLVKGYGLNEIEKYLEDYDIDIL